MQSLFKVSTNGFWPYYQELYVAAESVIEAHEKALRYARSTQNKDCKEGKVFRIEEIGRVITNE